MRYYEVPSQYEQRTHSSRPSVVVILILINVALFVAQRILLAFAEVNLERYGALRPSEAIQGLHVWQFVTYMFLHDHNYFFHILFNMLMLYMFGRELEFAIGRARFLILYLACGLYAGLTHSVAGYAMDATASPVIGASGAIYGIMVTFALLWPDRPILFFFVIPMKIWHAVMIFIGIDLLFALTPGSDGVAHSAHLGGALAAFLIFKLEPVADRLADRWETRSDRKRIQHEAATRQEVDRILDKISREGISRLTPGERTLLNRESRRLSGTTEKRDAHE